MMGMMGFGFTLAEKVPLMLALKVRYQGHDPLHRGIVRMPAPRRRQPEQAFGCTSDLLTHSFIASVAQQGKQLEHHRQNDAGRTVRKYRR